MRAEALIFQSILHGIGPKNTLCMSQTLFEFASQTENLAEVRAFVRRFLEAEGIGGCERELLVLGINEACSNIIRHAYGEQPRQPIALSCEREGGILRFRLRDFGEAADPTQFRRRSLEEVEPGGLGLHLMERIFDEAVYHPKSAGTELELIKRMQGSAGELQGKGTCG